MTGLLGEHSGFILAAYGFTAAVILSLIVHAVRDYRDQRKALDRLDRAGFGRNSAPPAPTRQTSAGEVAP